VEAPSAGDEGEAKSAGGRRAVRPGLPLSSSSAAKTGSASVTIWPRAGGAKGAVAASSKHASQHEGHESSLRTSMRDSSGVGTPLVRTPAHGKDCRGGDASEGS